MGVVEPQKPLLFSLLGFNPFELQESKFPKYDLVISDCPITTMAKANTG